VQSISSFAEAEIATTVMQEMDWIRCAADPVPLGPGTYRFTNYDAKYFKDPLVASTVIARIFSAGSPGVEGSVGGGLTVLNHRTPFLVAGGGVRWGCTWQMSIGVEYRSYWVKHTWSEMTIPESGSGTSKIVGTGTRPIGSAAVITSVRIPLR
jgi:hypothetical protein